MENKANDIIEFYLAENSQKATCEQFHISFRTLKKILTGNNVHIRTKGEVNKQTAEQRSKTLKDKLIYTEEQKNKVIELYVNQKRGQAYCCKEAGCSVKVLKKILNDNNIKIRDFSEAATISNINRAKDKNKEYFDTQSHNMAWVLGFLASDGNISKKDNAIKITLSAKDTEILKRIKAEIEIENELRYYTTSDGFDCVQLEWTCKEHKDALQKYSIVPNKTFVLKPPYALEKEYWIDYIRGYFDGDGSVNKMSNGLRWQICSASKEVLDWMIDFFEEEYKIPKVNIYKKEENTYYFQYSTNTTKKIYKILYSTDSDLFLQRKKDKYEEIIEVK